jgi:four helix bundle suffix protein
MTNKIKETNLIPPHGGYRKLFSYQMATIVYDLTQIFCKKYISNKIYTRTYDQMVQAARSGKQNIAEASINSGTSKKTELKLLGVARGSLEELLADLEDFLRQNELPIWEKEDIKSKKIRLLAYQKEKNYKTYISYMKDVEDAANCLICLINQTNFLLDRQIRKAAQNFLEEGGFSERLYQKRKEWRKSQWRQ